MKSRVLHPKHTYPQSVDVIVPLIIEMLCPHSVVDFGCGVGCWLAEFKSYGVNDTLGIDGHYITAEDLLIPKESYLAYDLEQVHELNLTQYFDVALCLECAEHLDAVVAPNLIKTICETSTHVVFSAAVPGQTGTGHKNEQYPDYWRALFAKEGFQMFDYFRPLIWNDPRVEFWYRQNMYLFSKAPHLFRRPTSKWDGSVYIARELLEIYVRVLNSINVESLTKNHIRARSKVRKSLTRGMVILRRVSRLLRREEA